MFYEVGRRGVPSCCTFGRFDQMRKLFCCHECRFEIKQKGLGCRLEVLPNSARVQCQTELTDRELSRRDVENIPSHLCPKPQKGIAKATKLRPRTLGSCPSMETHGARIGRLARVGCIDGPRFVSLAQIRVCLLFSDRVRVLQVLASENIQKSHQTPFWHMQKIS